VVKEMSQEELKAKMDRGDNFSRPPSGTPPTSPEPHRAFYFALEGLVDRFVSLQHYGLAVILVFVGATFVAQGKTCSRCARHPRASTVADEPAPSSLNAGRSLPNSCGA
jgi:hypothetical protein